MDFKYVRQEDIEAVLAVRIELKPSYIDVTVNGPELSPEAQTHYFTKLFSCPLLNDRRTPIDARGRIVNYDGTTCVDKVACRCWAIGIYRHLYRQAADRQDAELELYCRASRAIADIQQERLKTQAKAEIKAIATHDMSDPAYRRFRHIIKILKVQHFLTNDEIAQIG